MISLIYYTQKSLSLIKLKLNVFIPTLKSKKCEVIIPNSNAYTCILFKGLQKRANEFEGSCLFIIIINSTCTYKKIKNKKSSLDSRKTCHKNQYIYIFHLKSDFEGININNYLILFLFFKKMITIKTFINKALLTIVL